MDLRSQWTSGTARVRVHVRMVNLGGKIHQPGVVFSFASVFQTVLYTGVSRSMLNIRYSGLGDGGLVEDLPQRVDMAESSIPADMSWPVYNVAFYLSHHLLALCYQPREIS